MSDDKFSKYRRSTSVQRAATWPGWIAAALLLALTIYLWMMAIPVYFPSTSTTSSASLPTATHIENWKRPGELAVVYFDVGQGDAILIETPRGKHILIDSGEGKTPDSRYLKPVDAAGRIILPFLRQLGVRNLDVVIATHPHSDHIGAMPEIVGDRDITIGQLWISGFVYPSPSNKKMLSGANRREIAVYSPNPADLPVQIEVGDDVSLWILQADPNADGPNNSSIICKLVYGQVSFLFTGDAEKDPEKNAAMTFGAELKANIIKPAHHGSKTSSTTMFLNQVRPEVAIISVGSYNTFGHPHQQIIKRYQDMGTKIYRTDDQGTIFVFSDGNHYRVEPSRL